MPVEGIPFVTERQHKPVFSSVQEASDRINEILAEGTYVGQVALTASSNCDISYGSVTSLDRCEEGVVFLIDKPSE